MAANEARKHHYVPQSYMRRFACADDENKVMVLERHRDVAISDRKSVKNIGYDRCFHDARLDESDRLGHVALRWQMVAADRICSMR